jgi:hypothetical protein
LAGKSGDSIVVYDVAHDSIMHWADRTGATYAELKYWGDIDHDDAPELIIELDYYTLFEQDSIKTRIYSTGVDVPNAVPENNDNQLPTESKLAQNYPNPFNPTTIICYQVQRTGHVKLSVYNTLGQRVNTLVDENRSVGEYSVQWDGKDESGSSVASGVYFYQLEVGDFISSKKMVIIK